MGLEPRIAGIGLHLNGEVRMPNNGREMEKVLM
jgi:hypothetical protein